MMPRHTPTLSAWFGPRIQNEDDEGQNVYKTRWPDAPEHLRPLLDCFTEDTDILPSVKQDRNYQVKEAEGWYGENGGNIDLLKASIRKMKKIRYNISSMGSLRKTARGLKVKKTDPDSREERDKYLKGWFD